MKRTLEKVSVLSLSLLLISTYAVSAALPAMMKQFPDRSRAEVEQLISITSFAIMVVILLNAWLARVLEERLSIILGITLIITAGSAPAFVMQYEAIFLSRILLGIGIGLVNFHAVNMISERYEGEERSFLLGFRSAAEMLGNAALTLIAGLLLGLGWQYSFLVYLAAFPVLLLYLCFVPKRTSVQKKRAAEENTLLEPGKDSVREYAGFLISGVLLGGMMICMNSGNTLRIPALLLERNMGTEAQASVVLSIMMASGILGGAVFGWSVRVMKGKITAVSMLLFGTGMMIMAFSGSIFVLGLGAMLAGAAQNMMGTALFHNVSRKLPAGLTQLGTTCVLVGCNLGASCSPLVLKAVGVLGTSMNISFLVYGLVMLVLGGAGIWKGKR